MPTGCFQTHGDFEALMDAATRLLGAESRTQHSGRVKQISFVFPNKVVVQILAEI